MRVTPKPGKTNGWRITHTIVKGVKMYLFVMVLSTNGKQSFDVDFSFSENIIRAYFFPSTLAF